jgi:hypothetical protein
MYYHNLERLSPEFLYQSILLPFNQFHLPVRVRQDKVIRSDWQVYLFDNEAAQLQVLEESMVMQDEEYAKNPSNANLILTNSIRSEWLVLFDQLKIRAEERLRRSDLFRAGKRDSAWKVFHKLLNKHVGNNFQVNQMVEHFKSICCPVGKPLAVRPLLNFSYAPLPEEEAHFDEEFSIADLNTALASLNRTAAVGPQRISSNTIFLVLNGSSECKELFLALYNNCFNEGTMPLDWGHSEFFVLYKGKGDPNDCNNYRGISLQNDFFRLYERLKIIKFYPWGILKNIFGFDQCGFRKRRCTFDVTGSFISSMLFYTRYLNISAVSVFIDFKKAFPSLNRQELVNRLQIKGLPHKLLNGICASLSYNTTSLKFDGKISSRFGVTSGTREGGILSPPQFNSIISLIWEEGGFSIAPDDGRLLPGIAYAIGYADDIVCFCSDEGVFQSKLDWLVNKMLLFDLRINSDKTEVMIFHPGNGSRTMFSLRIENNLLKVVKNFNHLGFRIRDDLAFISQFDKIKLNSFSIAKRIGSLLFRLNVTDLKKIKMYFNAFVVSQFYGLPLLPDVSEIYLRCAAIYFKACFCLPTSMANCAAIKFLSPSSPYFLQIRSKSRFISRLVDEYGESSVLRIMNMDLEDLYEIKCGWAFGFLSVLRKFTVIPAEIEFESLNESIYTDAVSAFNDTIKIELITMSSLEMYRRILGTEELPSGFVEAISVQSPERARLIYIFLTGGLRWSFFNVSRQFCPKCALPFVPEHIFSCRDFSAENRNNTLTNIDINVSRDEWYDVIGDILSALRWWVYNCNSVRRSYLII